MPFSYEYDVNLAGQRLTPITKRQDVRLAFLQCIAEPIQWARDNFFDSYLEGNSSSEWSNVTAYSRYDRVNYQNRIYECLEDNTGESPTNEDYWVQVVGDFRGAKERIKYNCQTIMLEWVLNKWFATTFRQPSTGLDSDFYIVNNPRDGSTFTVYEDSVNNESEYIASSVFQGTDFVEQWVFEDPQYSFGANFTVYYPVSVIPTTNDDKYYQMTALINKYKLMGSTVDYISY